jgi:hypothetical protein
LDSARNCHQVAGPVGLFAQYFCFSLKRAADWLSWMAIHTLPALLPLILDINSGADSGADSGAEGVISSYHELNQEIGSPTI